MTAHLPVKRVIERACVLPDVQLRSIFALLVPFWAVEISATIREAQPYEIFDGYLSRAIAEARLDTPTDLAAFFGVDPSLVDRGLRFLTTIDHLRRTADTLTLTELGYQSVRDGTRYVLKEDRQHLYFDAFHCTPLPRTHYSGTVWLDEPKLELADRTAFRVISSTSPELRTDAVSALLGREDREHFNVPRALRDPKILAVRTAFLPVYAFDASPEPLVFSKAIDGVDTYLSRLFRQPLLELFDAEPPPDTTGVWRELLDGLGYRDAKLVRTRNGVLRAIVPDAAAGTTLKWHEVGSFRRRRQSFLQLWCTGADVRRQAVLERAAAMLRAGGVRQREDLEERMAELARQLEVPVPTVEELRRHAKRTGNEPALAALDAM